MSPTFIGYWHLMYAFVLVYQTLNIIYNVVLMYKAMQMKPWLYYTKYVFSVMNYICLARY